MKYGQNDIVDLIVFNENGNEVAKLDSLKESGIILSSDNPYIYVKDALLNGDILSFIGNIESFQGTDYEKYLGRKTATTIISLGKKDTKKCKLIAKGHVREQSSAIDKEIIYEFPSAEVVTSLDFDNKIGRVSDFDLFFNIKPYNDKGDLVRLHIQ